MIEPIATEIHDIEQQLIETNVKSILKKKIQNNNIRFTVFYNIILLFVIVPFIICDIYFALYDNCCMIENLRNFLFGSAFSTILLYIILVILSLILQFTNNNKKNIIYISDKIKLIYNLFFIIWTIIGIFIFWKINNYAFCSQHVFQYFYTILLLRLIYIFMIINECFRNLSN